RDRAGDVKEFVDQFFERLKLKHQRPDLQLPATLLPYLVNYRWPGNVRELENVIERLVLLSRGDAVALTDLPPAIRKAYTAGEATVVFTISLVGNTRLKA